jgi:hypothetical protein
MSSDYGTFMVVFLILILIFALFITYLVMGMKKTTEKYDNYYKPFGGRPPNAPPSCCGNLDWYMGEKKYQEYCAGKDEEKMVEYFGNLQENLTDFERQNEECKTKGLKAAYNPTVCTEEDSYKPAANCKCVDNKNNCKICYDEIRYK